MARSSSSASSSEPKTPLIIALVFFVLATIGLGVFAYMTNEDKVAAEAAAAEAAKAKTAAETTATKAREETLIYKAGMGLLSESDRAAFNGIQHKAEAAAAQRAMMEALAAKANQAIQNELKNFVGGGAMFSAVPEDLLRWQLPADGALQLPASSIIDNAIRAMAQREINDRTTKAEQKRYADSAKIMNEKSSEKDAAVKDFTQKTRDIPTQVATEADKIRKSYDEKTEQFKKEQQESRNTVESYNTKANQLDLEGKRLKERVATQDRRIDELLSREIDLIDPFQFDKPQGRILRRYSESLVDIDLGTSDKLRQGITFSVFPADTITRGMQPRMRPFRDPDGKEVFKPVPKAKIEVIDVIGPNIAQCRIIDEDNPVRDRVIPGDLLYNALWRKGVSEHVALYGIFDLDGDGRDDMASLVAGLRRVGVIVDAYYDLGKGDKGEWVGEITSQTNFGIEGYYPTVNAADGNKDEKIRILNGISEARKSIKEKGITILRPRDFFPRIGFNARLDVSTDAINMAATGLTRARATEKKPEGSSAPMDPNTPPPDKN